MHALTADELRQQCTLGEDARTWTTILRSVGVVGVVLAAVLGYMAKDDYAKFSYAYLVAFMFFLTIHLGALFFVAVNHLVGTKWNIVVRRLAELLTGNFVLLFFLFLPILIPVLMGNHSLYEWLDPVKRETDHLIHGKSGFLEGKFFAVRAVFYFLVWIGLSRFYLGNSKAQDLSGDPNITVKLRSRSAPAVILFALTTTFASFDWVMSLEPHWFSTIFGVYIFAGCSLSFFGTITLITLFMQERGRLTDVVSTEHYHDMGKWIFAFTFFWGYIAFSQYMLIWYADMPEETYWYKMRQVEPWSSLSMLLLIGHFIIPFGGIMSRQMKRNKATLGFWAAYVLLMHYVDLYWVIKPSLFTNELGFSMLDVACFVGLGGLLGAAYVARARGGLIAAIRDPFWNESLKFKNL